ncbi:MAG: hypothetical protein ABI634_11120 [Acidobacteriota bacterium]
MGTCRIVLIAVAAIVIASSNVAAVKLGPEHLAALERWTAAIDQHTPGRRDGALTGIAALTYDQRHRLAEALELFFAALSGRATSTSNSAEERIALIGVERSRAPGARRLLERAAVLHGDAVIFAPDLPAAPFDARDNQAGDSQLVSARDGEYQGRTQQSWHSKFARDLLDRVTPRPSSDPFVAQWYHSIVSYLMAYHRYGEATPLLQRAAELLPEDVLILFDRALLTEVTGLPRNQQVLMDPRAQEITGTAQGRVPIRTSLITERSANSEAERLCRRVLAIDATRADARMRLGRLLIVRTRYAEADIELARALATMPNRETSYLAHLFAGRANARLRKFEAAAAHVDAALVLFPNAQSALIAQSQLALQRADVTGALQPVERLAVIDHDRQPADPWMEYDSGAGREGAGALLTKLWSSVAR